jgi:predicted amidohydrolase
MRTLHIATAQIHSGGPMEETLQRVDRQIRSAASVGAEVILFSEVALHGYDYGMTAESVRAVRVS